MAVARLLNGAGGRNRTDETTLEEWSFTTKLHPLTFGQLHATGDVVKPVLQGEGRTSQGISC